MSNILIAYFSVNGKTAALAKTLSEITGGDSFEIKPIRPYAPEDLDWTNAKSRSSLEMKDSSVRPPIESVLENTEIYDTVFLGFPIWWYTVPTIVQTFLESHDFSGKTIVPFASSGGSDMGKIDAVLLENYPAVKWLPGKRMDNRETEASLKDWVQGLHL